MKKRKSPIILITILVLAVAGVFAINPAMNKFTPKDHHDHGHDHEGHDHAEEAPQKITTESRQTASREELAAQIRQQANVDEFAGAEDDGASIALPKGAYQAPKPDDSSTSTQWYTDESGVTGEE